MRAVVFEKCNAGWIHLPLIHLIRGNTRAEIEIFKLVSVHLPQTNT